MVLGVKIRNNNTGLFRLKDGSYSRNGKTYSTLGFAKSSITSDIPYNLAYILKKYKDCDFVIFNDDCTIDTIPVLNHVIYKLKEEKKYVEERIKEERSDSWRKHYEEQLDNLNIILNGLENE